jgi:hypothetical protein
MSDGEGGDAQKEPASEPQSLRARMEAESRRWLVQCARCGYEQSVWDWGGIRYKAAGTPRWYKKCPRCQRWSWHKVYLPKLPPGADPASGAPLAPLSEVKGRRTPIPFILGLALIIAAFVTVLLIAILALVGLLTQPVATAGDNFMAALQKGNYAEAYALCAPELQEEVNGASGIATRLQNYRPAQWTWTSRSIRNGVGRVEGSFTQTNGKGGGVRLIFNQVGGVWLVSSFQFTSN